jgi:phage tail-like protein
MSANLPPASGATVPQIELVVRLADQVEQTLQLRRDVLTIGRSPDNDLSLTRSPLVSRQHAELRRSLQGWHLTDLGSSNGTMLEERPLLPHQPVLVTVGQTIEIGTYQLMLSEVQPEEAIADDTSDVERVISAGSDPLPTSTADVEIPAGAAIVPLRPDRSSAPAPLAVSPASQYVNELPSIFHESDFMSRFLLIFETMWEPLESRQDNVAMYFDPRSAPAPLLPWLATWIQIPYRVNMPESRVREVLADAFELYRWRGTSYGLTRMIEACTGLTPVVVEDPHEPFTFRIRMRIPDGSEVTRDLIEHLIQMHKPAYAGYSLELLA